MTNHVFPCSRVNCLQAGKIRRVRGIAYSTRVSPQIGNRIIEGARSVLGSFTQDMFVSVEHAKGAESGLYVVVDVAVMVL